MIEAEELIKEAIEEAGKFKGKKAIVAVSGGVDSMVAAIISKKVLGNDLVPVFVDTGLLREGEVEEVREYAEECGLDIKILDESDRFISALKGVIDPEKKRKIIGREFIKVFERLAGEVGAEVLVQGTIAPDWIESGGQQRKTIKTHHNVGGIPKDAKLQICEPLREFYKHEVREIARALRVPERIFSRQPFPGPGLAIRIIGGVDEESLGIVRKADKIVREEIEARVEKKPWQYFAVLMGDRTVGVEGDERVYKRTVLIRCVESVDAMTAKPSRMEYSVLERIASRITNEIKEVGRVVYDITSKPPGTIEVE